MSRIYKRNDIWYADLHVNGKRIRRKVGKSKRVAELYLRDLELKAERNSLGIIDRPIISIEAFVKDFLDYSIIQNRTNTTRRYRNALDHFQIYIKKSTKLTLMSEVSTNTIEKYKKWRIQKENIKFRVNSKFNEKTASTPKSYTINFELMVIKLMFKLAVKWGYLGTNPSYGIKPLKIEDSKLRRFLTEAECNRLLSVMPKKYYAMFFTYLNTGMRRGELTNLEWSDIDFENRIIKIRRKPFWKPKTGEREIPINSELYAILFSMPKDGQFLFMTSNAVKYTDTWVRKKLIYFARKAGIEDLTQVHALRHTFASLLIKNGVDVPTVQKLMGHKSIETTMLYTHQTNEQMHDAVARIGIPENRDTSKLVELEV